MAQLKTVFDIYYATGEGYHISVYMGKFHTDEDAINAFLAKFPCVGKPDVVDGLYFDFDNKGIMFSEELKESLIKTSSAPFFNYYFSYNFNFS